MLMRISPAINGLLGQTEAFLICKRLSPSPLQPWLGLLWHQWQRLLGSSLMTHLIYHENSISLHSSILFPVSLKMALINLCNNFQVTTAPKSSTKVPADTSVFVPVLPETVPMFAQVWIHMQNFKWGWTFLLSPGSRCSCGAKTGDWWQSKGSNQPGEYFSVLEFPFQGLLSSTSCRWVV